MQGALPISGSNPPPVSARQWVIALLAAVLAHLAVFANYQTFVEVDPEGAQDVGREGIQIDLKKLLPPPSQKQVQEPPPRPEPKPEPKPAPKPKPKPKPEPIPEPAPVMIPEIIEEPLPQEISEEAVQEERVEDMAEEETPAVDESVSGGGNPELEVIYANRLLSWLERFKQYPLAARRRGQEDTILLQFTIRADGQLVSYEIIGSSRYPVLNEAVEAMIRQASPMPEIPPELRDGRTRFSYTVPVEFRLNR